MSVAYFKDASNYVKESGLKINTVYVSGNMDVFQRLVVKELVCSHKVLGLKLFSEQY